MAELSFPPLENGLDYMSSVVEHLVGTPKARDLKYAVLHLSAAIEVLLKARLMQEHWSLVFAQPDSASKEALASGDFVSIGARGAQARLEGIVGIVIQPTDKRSIRLVRDQRNRLQHHGLTETAEAVQGASVGALNFLLSFIGEQLADDLTESAAETFERIRSALPQIEEFVRVRMQSLKARLDEEVAVVDCPSCGQAALQLGDPCVCHFCFASGPPSEIARSYLWSILGESEYEAVKGRGGWSLSECPSCGQETLIKGVRVRPSPRHGVTGGPSLWCCFAEGVAWDDSKVDECMRCGAPILEDDGLSVCESCLAYVMDSD